MLNERKDGFTLIELLVVISIISLISSVVIASLSAARNRAKMSEFTQSMLEVRKAFEVYKFDHSQYPFEKDYWSSGASYLLKIDYDDGFTGLVDQITPLLGGTESMGSYILENGQSAFLPSYIAKIPTPPIIGGFNYMYLPEIRFVSGYQLSPMGVEYGTVYSNFYCGGKPVINQGYLIIFVDKAFGSLHSESYGLPLYIDRTNTPEASWEVNQGDYCILGEL